MRISKPLPALAVSILLVTAAFGQEVYTPEKGSEVRKEILGALRFSVEKELKQDIVFVITDLHVSNEWAFLGGSPKRPDGSSPDYSRTKYQKEIDEGFFDNDIFALLKKSPNGKWKVITYLIGCTDACMATWWKEYGAPKAIFPYTEDPSE